MTNFRIGQKVVYIGTDEGYPKRNYHIVRSIKKCSCGRIDIDCGHDLPSARHIAECDYCGHIDTDGIYWKDQLVFRPLSYTSNTNFEIIANFAPTEERADVIVKPEPVKEKQPCEEKKQ